MNKKEYKKYAEMISPDGSPASWDGATRLRVLEELTGIPQGTIAEYDIFSENIRNAKEKIEGLGAAPKNPVEKTTSVEKFIREKCNVKNFKKS